MSLRSDLSILSLNEEIKAIGKSIDKAIDKAIDQIIDKAIQNNDINMIVRLDAAIQTDDHNTIMQLIDHTSSDLRVRFNARINFALCEAVFENREASVRLLLQTDIVDPSAKNNLAIRIAALKGYDQIVRLLLATGKVDPSADNNFALQFAQKYGHFKVVEKLVEYNNTSNSGQSTAYNPRNCISRKHEIQIILNSADPRSLSTLNANSDKTIEDSVILQSYFQAIKNLCDYMQNFNLGSKSLKKLSRNIGSALAVKNNNKKHHYELHMKWLAKRLAEQNTSSRPSFNFLPFNSKRSPIIKLFYANLASLTIEKFNCNPTDAIEEIKLKLSIVADSLPKQSTNFIF